MIEFALPWAFVLLPLPLFMPFFLSPAKNKAQDALKVPFFESVAALSNGKTRLSRHAAFWKRISVVFIWFCLTAAAARPQWTGQPVRLPSKGHDIVLALDVSGSMAEKDFIFNQHLISRWDAVKRVAADFIEKRKGDRIGIVLFGTRAYRFFPLTADLKTAAELLREADVGMAGRQTAIGDGLASALKALKDTPEKSRVVILLSDGVANAGVFHPADAARMAKEQGVKVYTVGAGSSRHEQHTLLGQSIVFKTDDIDEKTLAAIAAETGASYFRASDFESLSRVYKIIDALEPVERKETFFRPIKELFYYPLAAAFIISVLLMSPSLFPRKKGVFS